MDHMNQNEFLIFGTIDVLNFSWVKKSQKNLNFQLFKNHKNSRD